MAVLTPAASKAATTDVMIQNYAFSPSNLTVHVGDTVTWTNMDNAPHTVTSSSGPTTLNSPQLTQGQSWSYTFKSPGTYNYYCAVHPNMKATITVLPASTGGGGSGGGGSGGGSPGGTGTGTCTGQNIVSSMITPFLVHFGQVHLEQSPSEQVSQILNVDQYVALHTALVETMLTPAYNLLIAAPNGINPLLVHLDHAHLEPSPAEQVSQAANVNQYVQAHTVLAENMLDPTFQSIEGTYGC